MVNFQDVPLLKALCYRKYPIRPVCFCKLQTYWNLCRMCSWTQNLCRMCSWTQNVYKNLRQGLLVRVGCLVVCTSVMFGSTVSSLFVYKIFAPQVYAVLPSIKPLHWLQTSINEWKQQVPRRSFSVGRHWWFLQTW